MDVNLVMFGRGGARKDFPILNRLTTIGRGRECDLRVPLLTVSRKHCQLIVDGETLRIRDISSSNGTFVNNQKVTEARLGPGDRIVIGSVVFTVQINGIPDDVKPSKAELPREETSEKAAMADTSVSLAAKAQQELDPITALENLVAETLSEDEEEDEGHETQAKENEDEGKL